MPELNSRKTDQFAGVGGKRGHYIFLNYIQSNLFGRLPLAVIKSAVQIATQ